eukprot:6492438-Amphidinium_carterae.1
MLLVRLLLFPLASFRHLDSGALTRWVSMPSLRAVPTTWKLPRWPSHKLILKHVQAQSVTADLDQAFAQISPSMLCTAWPSLANLYQTRHGTVSR